MKNIFDVSGNVILITGALGLLGNHYARFLVSKGAKIIAVDLDMEKLSELEIELNSKYGDKACIGMKADVTSEKDVAAIVQTALRYHNKIDVLINNAGISGRFFKEEPHRGIPRPTTFEEYQLEDWQKTIDVNITGMFLCCREVSKQMTKQKKGVIINISSTYGLDGPDQRIYQENIKKKVRQVFIKPVSYSVSKGAVIALTKYLAAYFSGSNIRVNTLTPGGVREDSQSKEFQKRYANKTIMGRMAEPDEYLGAVLFLISDASKYMTGANLIIDGGWTAW